jgi:GxxExxY protein
MNTDKTIQGMELIGKELTEKIIGACFEVSNELGAGFLESVYQKALQIALSQKNMRVEIQSPLKVLFRGQVVGDFYADMIIEDSVIVELKVAKALSSEHEAQLMNYLKATKMRVGLLVNLGKPKLEWKRFVN